MSTHEPAARDAVLDFLWSLWSELGVRGPHRRHPRAIIDPELLILFSPWLGRSDARLLDLVFSWCSGNADRVSLSRLAGFCARIAPEVRFSAESFFAELTTVGVHWTRQAPPAPVPPRDLIDLTIPTDRATTWRFRMRALAGVGGRADVLTALLAAPDAWVDAASLDDVGIAKRNIARTLSNLAKGRVVHVRPRGNTLEFKLRTPRELAVVTDLREEAFFPRWHAIFDWMVLTDELCALAGDQPVTARVEVARRRQKLTDLAAILDFDEPGEGADAVIVWALSHARAIADGTSSAVGGSRAPSRQAGEV